MRALLLVALLCGFASPALTQDDAPAESIPPELIASRAEALSKQIEASEPSDDTREAFEEIEKGLEAAVPRLDALAERIEADVEGDVRLTEVGDLRNELEALALPLLDDWEETLDAEAVRVAELMDRLRRTEARWSETVRHPETVKSGEAVVKRARASLELVGQAKGELAEWDGRVLALQDRVAQTRMRVDAQFDLLAEAEIEQRESLLIAEQAPIWQVGVADALRSELPRVPQALIDFNAQTRNYLANESRYLAAQAILALLLILLFRHASRRARVRAAGDPELAAATRVLERPFSIALLLTLLATPWLHPVAPFRFRQLITVLLLFAVARIVNLASDRTHRGVLAGLFAILVLDRGGLSLMELPTLTRAVYLFALVVAVATSGFVMRKGGLPGPPVLVRRGAAFALAAFSFSLLAEIGGWIGLSALVGRGALIAVLGGVYVWAAIVAVDALLAWSLRSPRIARFGLEQPEGQLAELRARRVVRGLGLVLWVYYVLGALAIREEALGAVGTLLAAGIKVGALSLTLGGVLAFVLTIVIAPILGRFINLILDQGVFPRTELPRGVPYAVKTLVRYAVFTLAFLAALAAAGVQLSQLSILLGGLGVGVGLGLQDVVKNFAAGLTLLLERRVHVGDVVQVRGSDIFGRVLEIGMRASVVRNWDGAEVVVPNADLVASAVTNWTLSDQLRRIEIPVGVAYGTDPERVVALLLEVAHQHSDVLKHPPTQALFQGFGDSSLDFLLRAWSDAVYDRTLAIRSDLVIAIHSALREAGITIPFPQRDLHLASVSPAARDRILEREGG
jgi:small-conductance mechanosensitive channel